MQSCKVVDVFHQWSIITCLWERGWERKKEQSTTWSKQRTWERKEELQLDQSKGESEREIKQEVEAIGERARKKETIKQKRGMGWN